MCHRSSIVIQKSGSPLETTDARWRFAAAGDPVPTDGIRRERCGEHKRRARSWGWAPEG